MADFDFHVYTDGSCWAKDKIGGYGFVLFPVGQEGRAIERCKGYKNTTNNRMEMRAVIEALKLIPDVKARVLVHSDSQYTINGITQWIHKWKRNGVLEDMKNADLWEEFYPLVHERKNLTIDFKWVKGHAGNKFNEVADELAGEAAKLVRSGACTDYITDVS